MSDSFYCKRFSKKVWLTNHAIESMNKRDVTLFEVKQILENGEYQQTDTEHGWIYFDFEHRTDNLVCVAIIEKESIIIKTVMINWTLREDK